MGRTTKKPIKGRLEPYDRGDIKPRTGTENMSARRKEIGLPPKLKDKTVYRESIYDPLRTPHIGYALSKEFGFTQEGLALAFDVSPKTVTKWCSRYPTFAAMVKKGRDEYDGTKVESALLKKCLGYTFQEKSVKKIKLLGKIDDKVEVNVPAVEIITTTKHMSPDTKAMMFWLQNRNSERWRNMTYAKVEVEGNVTRTELTADLTNMKSEDIRALRDIIMSQQQKQIPAECQSLNDDDLDKIIDKARNIEDAILISKE